MNKLLCKICDNEVKPKGISRHLKMLHGIKFIDYVTENIDDFPNYSACETCGTISNGRTCSVKCLAKLKKTWVGKDAPRYGAVLSDETKVKMRDARIEYHEENEHWNQNNTTSFETRAKISKTRIKRGVAKGKNNPMYGKTHSSKSLNNILNRYTMNKLEKKVADLLTENGIEYYYQFFITRGDICKAYDFKIKGKPILLEIDGDYWHGGPKSKKTKPFIALEKTMKNDEFKNKFAEEHGYEVLRFWESEFNKNPSIILEALNV